MTTFERQSLDNGLRVLLASMPQATSVTCMIMLAAGSRYETSETNGIAHFAELNVLDLDDADPRVAPVKKALRDEGLGAALALLKDQQDLMDKVNGVAEVIIGKQRHGPTGNVELQFDASLTKIQNLIRADYLPEQFS